MITNTLLKQKLAAAAWIVISVFTAPAFAAGTATVEGSGPSGSVEMKIRWAGDNLRMDFPAQPGTYMIVREGKTFSVSSQGGQVMVMDMSSMGQMAQAMGAQAGVAIGPQSAVSLEKVEATGEDETVAGIPGEVYRIDWTDGSGNKRSDTAVLTDNPLVFELTDAFRRHVEAMGVGATDPIGKALAIREMGVLRFANNFRVLSIAEDTPSSDLFKLPAEPMNLQQMMQGMGGAR